MMGSRRWRLMTFHARLFVPNYGVIDGLGNANGLCTCTRHIRHSRCPAADETLMVDHEVAIAFSAVIVSAFFW